MNRVVRCIVMGLLVLALPVHGFAASTMLLCGAGHHGAVQVGEGGHDHHSQADATPAGSAFSPLSAKHTTKVAGKCNVCAACCTVAFLPTTVIAFMAPAPDRAPAVVELTTHVGFFTDGPDRPPRPFLA